MITGRYNPTTAQERRLLPATIRTTTATMKSSSPLIPTATQIAVAPLEASELDFEVTENDQDYLIDFQDAWTKFLLQRPELVPRGQLGQRIDSLHHQTEFERATNEAVHLELKKQLQFFTSSRESLEDLFTFKLNEAMERQRELHDELQIKLDTVALADQLQAQTVPWMHFLQQLDRLNAAKTAEAAAAATDKPEEEPSNNRAVKPSARAMALTDVSSGDSADIMLRAYRTDHALLTTHIAKSQKEIERYVKLIQSQEVAGLFLTEHNVWSLLSNKAEDADASTTTGVSTTTGASTKLEPETSD